MPNKIKSLFYLLPALVLSATTLADTLVHDVRGYTSSDNGILEFTVLVFDDAGKIAAAILEWHRQLP